MMSKSYQTLRASTTQLTEAAALLRAGGLVAFPTETVYGLGGDATNSTAVAKIFRTKNRPEYNPIICHVADIESARELGVFNDKAELLAHNFWPGPLTMILPRTSDCPIDPAVSAGLSTIALRIPNHEMALSLLRKTGRPLAAPSANRSGAVSPTSAGHVIESLGKDADLVLDGGACSIGIESTVIALDGTKPILMRPGGVTSEMLNNSIGQLHETESFKTRALKSPGMLVSHYAPSLPVRLNVSDAKDGEALLAFGSNFPAADEAVLNLSPEGNLSEAATNLFDYLRRLDLDKFEAIAVTPIPDKGLGHAINDRLRRAAAPRPIKP